MKFSVLQKILNSMFIGSLIFLIFCFLQLKTLPETGAILPVLSQDPIQEKIEHPKSFTHEYKETKYTIDPLYDYELWGLVVSHNDISEFSDIYHDEDSFDTKDLCVIWGENLKNNDYQNIDFKSGSWTCYVHYPAGVSFSSSHLSNNHLITDSENIREKISDISRGDQIHMKGKLVNYGVSKNSWKRNTSTTRTDTGNTACEVIFVEEIKILKKRSPDWNFWLSISKYVLILLVFARVSLSVYMIRLEEKKYRLASEK